MSWWIQRKYIGSHTSQENTKFNNYFTNILQYQEAVMRISLYSKLKIREVLFLKKY
jgi:hypothetical protein